MAKELWFVAPHRVELRERAQQVCPPEHVVVRGLFSAVSHGTESLLYRGLGPEIFDPSLADAAAPTYPCRYGYAWVGEVTTPGDHAGAVVFALASHAEEHVLPLSQLRFLPNGLLPQRATLAASMETALTAVWDAEIKVGERAAVIGGGTVGSLVARVAARAGADVTVVEARPERRELVRRLGLAVVEHAAQLPAKCDVVFEASGDPTSLDAAIDLCGFEARVVVVSFYGAKVAPVALGDRFHRQRLRLISSQVSTIPAALRSRWDAARRFETVCELLMDERLVPLTERIVDFAKAVDVYAQLADGRSPVQVIFRY